MKEKTIWLTAGVIGAIGVAFIVLQHANATSVTGVATPTSNKSPVINIPPLDIAGLGNNYSNLPLPASTGLNVPSLVDPLAKDSCCNDCRADDISTSFVQQFVNASTLGPQQPFIDMSTLTDAERSALDQNNAQIVYDPTATRGYYVGVLSQNSSATIGGVVYTGGLPTLPPWGNGG